ncbi:hypothetical protein GCM10022285_28170 [Streptomyces tunisiensis]|uniref:Uncharacterized protein n=1 Tax=Streptomyces tunisiensis TaxID=948699 RepID=A0ABP7YFC9_9ACTN
MGASLVVEVDGPRGDDTELVPLGVRHHQEAAVLVPLRAPAPEPFDPALLGGRVGRGDVDVHAVLAGLGSVGALEAQRQAVLPAQPDIGARAAHDGPAEHLRPERGEPLGVRRVEDEGVDPC